MGDVSNRIRHLEEMHRVLDLKITEMEKHPHVEESKVAELKRQKLKYKDEITRLTRVEWEEKHERLPEDFNDH